MAKAKEPIEPEVSEPVAIVAPDNTPVVWWGSKLNWVGILTTAIALMTALMEVDFIKENPKLVMYIVAGIGVLTSLLRIFTPLRPIASKIIALLLCVSLLSQSGYAADITTPTGASEHTLIRVKSDKPGSWVVLGPDVLSFQEQARINHMALGTTAINWRETIILDNGKECVFTGPPGTYVAILFVEADKQPTHTVVVVKASGPGPPPMIPLPPTTPAPLPLPPVTPPAPTPNPPVTPIPVPPTPAQIPAGQYNIARTAFDEAMKIPYPQRTLAAGIRDNFLAIVEAIDAKQFMTAKEASGALMGLNRDVLGMDGDPRIEAWRPWFKAWQRVADTHMTSGKLRADVADWKILFQETATGLGAVK